MARILVVDDQEEVAELVQAVLKDAGHAAEAVYSGQAALDRLKRTVYDLVVCDVRMPEVDGRAVSRAIAQLVPPRPVVLFMTGYGDSPIEAEFLQTTTAVVLAKPLGIDELLARVGGGAARTNRSPGPRRRSSKRVSGSSRRSAGIARARKQCSSLHSRCRR